MTSRIVKTVSRTIIPFIFLFGIYIIIHGHLSPGGGFQGGVIMAMGVILVIISYGYDTLRNYTTSFSVIETLGVAFFIFMGLIGILAGKSFFSNLGAIWLLNIIIGLKVCSGIVLFYMLFIKWEHPP
ncbi:MAG: MnhB domain-containing protein [Candidatus Thermoplasmatota archaeon]|nr:MnhB domain-containing protein [Candidatus Thermoplasmatota archaeon]MBS3801222.1 MnhB domain-containing protein [Candidatus Thermoplasmatota archaeon]